MDPPTCFLIIDAGQQKVILLSSDLIWTICNLEVVSSKPPIISCEAKERLKLGYVVWAGP